MNAGVWISIGVIAMIAEFVIPGFIVFFFGIGAVVTGGMLFLFPSMGISLQVMCFMILSIATLLGVRHYLPKTFYGRSRKSELPEEDLENAGDIVTVTENIEPARAGHVSFQGSIWKAESDECIPAGQQAQIVCRKNVVLIVRKLNSFKDLKP